MDMITVRTDHGHSISIPILAEPAQDLLEFPTQLSIRMKSTDKEYVEYNGTPIFG